MICHWFGNNRLSVRHGDKNRDKIGFISKGEHSDENIRPITRGSFVQQVLYVIGMVK